MPRPNETRRPTEKHRFIVEMPVALHAELRELADQEHRSVVGQVNHIVDLYLRETK